MIQKTAQHAVIVAGHAILKRFDDIESDASWMLLDFQKGEPKHYIRHVQRGVELAAADPEALLIFSGGQSRAEAGPRSEAQSYFAIADMRGWWGVHDVARRAITEEFARDSFENLLFGICRFKEYTGAYPLHVTLVSWAFKEERFQLHRQAIQWPRERFTYEGPNNPDALDQALRAEQNAIRNYTADPYSLSEMYVAKRAERNPFRRQHGYFTSCPDAAQVLLHKGPEPFAAAAAPWRA
jgi:hypothetical protein